MSPPAAVTTGEPVAPVELSAVTRAQIALVTVACVVAGCSLSIAGLWLWVDPPEEVTQGGLVALSLLVGPLVLASLRRRGTVVVGARIAASGGLLVAFVWMQNSEGLRGWWPQSELVVIALMATICLQLPLRTAAVLGIGVVGGLTAATLSAESAEYLLHSPTIALARVARVLMFAVILVLATEVLRRGARSIDRAAARMLAAERTATFARASLQAENEARRVVHDTVLNTLEAAALGVPPPLRGQLRARAEQDASALQLLADAAAIQPELSQLLRQAADRFGLELVDRVVWRGTPDTAVFRAVSGAAFEALQNVAQHSGAREVVVEGTVTPWTTELRIADHGSGFVRADPGRLGVVESIQGRLADVGGQARIRSTPGRGTIVELSVDAVAQPEEHELLDLVRRTVGWLAVVAAVVAGAAVLSDLGGIALPWLHLSLIAVCLVATLWLTQVDQIGLPEIVVVLAVVGGTILLTPLADPYCASWLRESSLPDNRILLVLAVAAFAPTIRLVVVLVAGTVASGVVATLLSHHTWPACGNEFVIVPVVGLGFVAGAMVFGRAFRQQQAELAGDREMQLTALGEAAAAEARIRVERQWSVAAAVDAVDLLAEIGRSSTDVSDPRIRGLAAQRAQALRAFVVISRAPTAVAGTLLQLHERLRQIDASLTVAGDPAGLPKVPAPGLTAWVEAVAEREPDSVRITFTVSGTVRSVSLFAAGVRVAQSGPDLDCWTESDGSWCIWRPQNTSEWEGVAAAPVSGTAYTSSTHKGEIA